MVMHEIEVLSHHLSRFSLISTEIVGCSSKCTSDELVHEVQTRIWQQNEDLKSHKLNLGAFFSILDIF